MIKHSGSFFSPLFFLFFAVDAWSQETSGNLVQRGQYVFSLGVRCACHTSPRGHQISARVNSLFLWQRSNRLILPQINRRVWGIGRINRFAIP